MTDVTLLNYLLLNDLCISTHNDREEEEEGGEEEKGRKKIEGRQGQGEGEKGKKRGKDRGR